MNLHMKNTALIIGMVLCLAFLTVSVTAATTLQITLLTNKQSYWLGDMVQIYGYLDANGSRVYDGMINLEMDTPASSDGGSYPTLFRTLPTGTTPTAQQAIQITTLFCSNDQGLPKSNIKRGTGGHFNVTLLNNNDTAITGYTLTLSVFDTLKGIVDSGYISNSNLLPHGKITYNIPFYVQSGAPLGTARIYANVFTKLPRQGGYLIAYEKNNTFSITDTALAAEQITAKQSPTSQNVLAGANGQWLANFSIPRYRYVGNYSIYTSARYAKTTTTAQKTIEVRVPDVNKDGKINVLDLIKVASKLGWVGTPGSIPEDVDRNGRVNVLDLIKVGQYIGWQQPP
jgi:hypothetical protein